MSFLWTTEKIQTAVELWNAGKTGSEIAQAINAPSRGSVTRKIARLRARGMPVTERSSSRETLCGNVVFRKVVPRPDHGCSFVESKRHVTDAVRAGKSGDTDALGPSARVRSGRSRSTTSEGRRLR